MKKISIIGAGPAGLTAAYKLAYAGYSVAIFEAGPSVGGMAKTIPLWNQLVDLGPHRFFSSDPRVNSFWLEILGNNYIMVRRLTRIYYKGLFFYYPLKALNALIGLGMIEAFICIFSFAKAKLFPIKDESNFQNWVINRFGSRLFTIFFKAYSEKLWGIKCDQLDADFASQRIKKLSLYEAIKSIFYSSGSVNHKTLVDEFAYPKFGAGAFYEVLGKKIIELGGEIHLNTSVFSVQPGGHQKKPLLNLENGEVLEFDHIISSMPITNLVKRMNPPTAVLNHALNLTFRNTILVYLQIDNSRLFPDQWIYVHAPELKTGRITNFQNWSEEITGNQDHSIICLEYWCYDRDPIWLDADSNLIELATKEIYQTKLAHSNSVKAGYVYRVPKCYPVYKCGYQDHLRPIETWLKKQENLSVIGRYGSFKYNNQDHSILMGLLAAENISKDAQHNLWDINTDYEYQESSKITSTGLKLL